MVAGAGPPGALDHAGRASREARPLRGGWPGGPGQPPSGSGSRRAEEHAAAANQGQTGPPVGGPGLTAAASMVLVRAR